MLTPTEFRALFDHVNEWAMKKCPLVTKRSIRIGCRQIADVRKRGDKRAFFHVGHYPGQVCADPHSLTLPIHFLVGLFLHELGHPLAMKTYGKTEQWDADRAVKEFLGVRLKYGGPLILEYVDPDVAQRIIGA